MSLFGFLLYVLFIPLAVFGVSQWLDTHYSKKGNVWWLVIACLLFSLSYFLPSPAIHGHETQFMTHVVGGGIFCGFLWVYHRTKLTSVPYVWYWELGGLFALTSALGTLNELYELLAFEVLGSMPVQDTSYDLLANTLGMLVFFVVYKLVLHTSRK